MKSIKSGSPEALHPLKRKENETKVSEPTILLEQKKMRTKGKDGAVKVKNHAKRTFIPHTHMHMTKF
jgi:hypothetical protein